MFEASDSYAMKRAIRWSWETVALREGPFGKLPWAVESRNVVREDSVRAPTPLAGVPSLPPLSTPTLKLLSFFLSLPPHATRPIDSASTARSEPAREGFGDMESAYVCQSVTAIGL